jgi:hypothetical protein
MNAANRQEFFRRAVLAAWGMLTLILAFTVALLVYEMRRTGAAASSPYPAEHRPGPAPEPPATATGDTREVRLFFADGEGKALVPEVRRIDWAESAVDNCRNVLTAIIGGPEGPLTRIVPASARVRALYFLEGGELVVDFSFDLAQERPISASADTLMVYGIVNTLAQPTLELEKGIAVKKVRFLVEGASPQDSFGSHLDMSQPFVPDPQWTQAGQDLLTRNG